MKKLISLALAAGIALVGVSTVQAISESVSYTHLTLPTTPYV